MGGKYGAAIRDVEILQPVSRCVLSWPLCFWTCHRKGTVTTCLLSKTSNQIQTKPTKQKQSDIIVLANKLDISGFCQSKENCVGSTWHDTFMFHQRTTLFSSLFLPSFTLIILYFTPSFPPTHFVEATYFSLLPQNESYFVLRFDFISSYSYYNLPPLVYLDF